MRCDCFFKMLRWRDSNVVQAAHSNMDLIPTLYSTTSYSILDC
jgi:hypothetical protein